jgi:hypothetical protein
MEGLRTWFLRSAMAALWCFSCPLLNTCATQHVTTAEMAVQRQRRVLHASGTLLMPLRPLMCCCCFFGRRASLAARATARSSAICFLTGFLL